MHSLQLAVLPDVFAISRLAPDAAVPAWAQLSSGLVSITRSPDELSIVCAADQVPADTQAERGWSCLRIRGPLDFALVGVLAAITQPLAAAGVSLFALSTYDTDYVLVRSSSIELAISALERAGHDVVR